MLCNCYPSDTLRLHSSPVSKPYTGEATAIGGQKELGLKPIIQTLSEEETVKCNLPVGPTLRRWQISLNWQLLHNVKLAWKRKGVNEEDTYTSLKKWALGETWEPQHEESCKPETSNNDTYPWHLRSQCRLELQKDRWSYLFTFILKVQIKI